MSGNLKIIYRFCILQKKIVYDPELTREQRNKGADRVIIRIFSLSFWYMVQWNLPTDSVNVFILLSLRFILYPTNRFGIVLVYMDQVRETSMTYIIFLQPGRDKILHFHTHTNTHRTK